MDTNDLAYWVHGTAYCAACVECDTPCLDEDERRAALCRPGEGQCACCWRPFGEPAVQE